MPFLVEGGKNHRHTSRVYSGAAGSEEAWGAPVIPEGAGAFQAAAFGLCFP